MRDEDENDDYLWDGQGTPDPEVQRLEQLLGPVKYDRPAPQMPKRRMTPGLFVGLAAAAMPIVAYFVFTHGSRHHEIAGPPGPREPAGWFVESVSGAPACGGPGACTALLVGQWLTTDASSSARVRIADIGWLELAPASRLRLKATGANEHRLELAVGQLHASVDAPPRLLVIETPSGTAVDLGCAYTLAVAPDGAGLLEVTSGYVSLEDPGRAAFVPAGAQAETRVGVGPGTPHFPDATAAFRAALRRFDFEAGGADALAAALATARLRDTLSLWNLIARTDGVERKRVIDRLEELGAAYPEGVDREALMRLDPDALTRWRQVLQHTW